MLRSTWFRRLVLATVVPLLVVELVLQLGALGVALFASSRERAGAGGCAVLCVGDSYTYGLGASRAENSYPAALETLLRAAPIDGCSRVVNGGWPGRNSRNVIDVLPRQVSEFRPRRVAILLGVNDFWSHPDHVALEDSAGSSGGGGGSSRFRFEWRLPRLIALVARSTKVQGFFIPTGGASSSGAPPVASAKSPASEAAQPAARLVGKWRAGEAFLELAADGCATFGGESRRWTSDAETIEFTGAGAPIRARWKLADDRLRLVLAGEAKVREFVRVKDAPPQPVDWGARAWASIFAGDLPKALEYARSWLAIEPDSAWAHCLLVAVGTRLSRPEIVEEGFAWLRTRAESRPDVVVAEALATSLGEANRSEESGRSARADLARWPESVMLWTKLAESAEVARDLPTLEEAVEKAIALDPHERAYPLTSNLRLRSRLRLMKSDLRGAARDALAAYAIDGNEGELRNALRRVGMECDPELVDALAADTGLAGERLAAARRVAGEPPAADDGAAASTLVDHLTQIVRYCRDHGAEPLLLTYPFHGDAVEKVQREVARKTGTALVEVTARFDRLLQEHAREELFVPDGHCNDLGYRFVAEEVARTLREK